MTREEILAEIEIDTNGEPYYTRHEALSAMSEYAQQEAIAFSDWKDKNVQKHNGKYYVFTYEYPFDNNIQLYQIFKTQNNG